MGPLSRTLLLPTSVHSPQAVGKQLEQGSKLGGRWEGPEVNNLSLAGASVSQMRKTSFGGKKKWGLDQFELAIDRKIKDRQLFWDC